MTSCDWINAMILTNTHTMEIKKQLHNLRVWSESELESEQRWRCETARICLLFAVCVSPYRVSENYCNELGVCVCVWARELTIFWGKLNWIRKQLKIIMWHIQSPHATWHNYQHCELWFCVKTDPNTTCTHITTSESNAICDLLNAAEQWAGAACQPASQSGSHGSQQAKRFAPIWM